jgi:hypothetical protein
MGRTAVLINALIARTKSSETLVYALQKQVRGLQSQVTSLQEQIEKERNKAYLEGEWSKPMSKKEMAGLLDLGTRAFATFSKQHGMRSINRQQWQICLTTMDRRTRKKLSPEDDLTNKKTRSKSLPDIAPGLARRIGEV